MYSDWDAIYMRQDGKEALQEIKDSLQAEK